MTSRPSESENSQNAGLALRNEGQRSISDDRETVYSPESELRQGWSIPANIFRNFVAGRELAWRLLQRNLRGMYRQTLFGVMWAFLPPLANALIWIFLYSQNVVRFGDQIPVPYPLYVLTGMIVWQTFVESLQMPLNVVRQNRSMLTKLHFPREALLVVGWGETILNFVIRLLILLPILLFYQVPLTWTVWAFPFAVFLLIVLGTALGLCLMPLGVLYQDVERLLLIGLPLWMVITPIIYASEAVPAWVHRLNPVAGLLMVARDSLIQATYTHWEMAVVYGLIALPLLFLGLIVYRISLPILVERMPG